MPPAPPANARPGVQLTLADRVTAALGAASRAASSAGTGAGAAAVQPLLLPDGAAQEVCAAQPAEDAPKCGVQPAARASAKSPAGCTPALAPAARAASPRRPSPVVMSAAEIDERLSALYARTCDWRRRCQERYDRVRAEREGASLEECTFAPAINTISRRMFSVSEGGALGGEGGVAARGKERLAVGTEGRATHEAARPVRAAPTLLTLGPRPAPLAAQDGVVRYPIRPILAGDAPARDSLARPGRSASAPRSSSSRSPSEGRGRSPAGVRGPSPRPQRARSVSPDAAAAAAARLYDNAIAQRARREQLVYTTIAAEREAREWVAPDSAAGVAPRVYEPPSRGRSPERVPHSGAPGWGAVAAGGVGGWGGGSQRLASCTTLGTALDAACAPSPTPAAPARRAPPSTAGAPGEWGSAAGGRARSAGRADQPPSQGGGAELRRLLGLDDDTAGRGGGGGAAAGGGLDPEERERREREFADFIGRQHAFLEERAMRLQEERRRRQEPVPAFKVRRGKAAGRGRARAWRLRASAAVTAAPALSPNLPFLPSCPTTARSPPPRSVCCASARRAPAHRRPACRRSRCRSRARGRAPPRPPAPAARPAPGPRPSCCAWSSS
jgi:hypothetical protein